MYDTVAQYGQVLSGDIDDWHPPVLVRLWQLLHPLAAGTAPMFLVQVVLYAAGFSLIIGALAITGRWRSALGAALLALSPLLLGWQMVVLKDAQMLGGLLAALGIFAHYHLTNRRMPAAAAIVVGLLLVYATLVRANGLFATVPLVVLMLPKRKRLLPSAALAVAAMAAVLAVTPLINHRLFGAEPSGVAKTQPVFDLAAIAVASHDRTLFTEAELAQIDARHCVKAFFWDPLGDPTACSAATERLMDEPAGQLYAALAQSVGRHPLGYALHRVAHWNSTERWLVEPGLPDEAPPIEAEANDLDLGTPSSQTAATWQDDAAVEGATPLGWPIVWTVIALALLPAAWRRRGDPAGNVSFALVVSALTLEASFLLVSIASDLRYHLWPMAASALALVLLADDLRLKRLERIAAAAALLFVIAGGIVARNSLPRAADNYEGMVHAASG